MSKDSYIECIYCGKGQPVNFGRRLTGGWPKCCGETMRLIGTMADIDLAVGEVFRKARTK